MSEAVERFREQQFRVLVGLGHPRSVEGLMRIASVFARRQKGRIVAASVITVPPGADLERGADYADPQALELSEAMVQRAQDFGAELGIAVEPVVQFAHDIPSGIAAICEGLGPHMILLGYSPPEAPQEQADVPARITERVAGMAGPLLAIVALPDGDEPARMLIPVTEALDPAVIRDLAKVIAIFGGAEMTFLGLVPTGLSEDEFERRSGELRAKLEGVDFEDIECLDLDARRTSECLFGAEARQMSGATHDAAFILRATV